jgi:nucleoside-diphosphate-sugar epimerase
MTQGGMTTPLPKSAVVLVTGASGFLGSHILARLVTREDCIVHAVNRRGDGPGSDRVNWHAADLRVAEAAHNLVRRIRPSHLLHNAWIAVPGRFWSDPENLDWLQAGLALMRGFGEMGGRRFVGVRTCAEYDWQQTRFVEDETPIRPATLYGKSKAAMWAGAQAFAARYGFSAAWGRIFLPYGPGDSAERLLPMLIGSLLARRPVALGDGTAERDFIHVSDVADLLLRLLSGGDEGAFNIGTGRATEIRAVAERIADRFGERSLLTFDARRLPAEPRRIVADMKKTSEIDWPVTRRRLEDELEWMLDSAVRDHGLQPSAEASAK